MGANNSVLQYSCTCFTHEFICDIYYVLVYLVAMAQHCCCSAEEKIDFVTFLQHLEPIRTGPW